jgi:lysophospholipase L1-like esterase
MTSRPRALSSLIELCAAALTLAMLSWTAACSEPEPHADDSSDMNATVDIPRDGSKPSRPEAATSTSGAQGDASAAVVDDGDGDAPHLPGTTAAGDASSSAAPDAGARGLPTDAAVDAGSRDAGQLPALPSEVTLHVAGDSTSAIFPASDPTHRVGWAAVLQPFFSGGVRVDDAAQSGRSSKSYLDEGLWKKLREKIEAGDYVFVEFGHNDEKSDDAARYTDPATTFRDNLELYVKETRAAGGVPVLLTPISRRQFSGSKIGASHGAYPAAVLAVATKTNTPLIDMTERTRVWLESIGPSGSVSMFATNDNTHLSAKGADEVAKLAVQGIRALGLPLAERLLP